MPKDFDLKKLPIEAQDKSIKADDFKFVDSKNRTHEQKFQTRPTTFLKDSLKRFAKNKSSVVASVILGILLLMAVFVPVLDPYEIHTDSSQYMTYLEPKLFDSGTGFWDGCKQWEKIPTKTFNNVTGEEYPNQEDWWPNPERFPEKSAISNKTFSDPTFTDKATKYGKGGYVNFSFNEKTPANQRVYFRTVSFTDTFDINTTTVNLVNFQTYDLNKLKAENSGKDGVALPENTTVGEVEMYFGFLKTDNTGKKVDTTYKVLDAKKVFNIGTTDPSVNLTDNLRQALLDAEDSQTEFDGAYFEIRLVNSGPRVNTCSLIKSVEFDVDSTNSSLKEEITKANFTDATQCVLREPDYKDVNDNKHTDHSYWECNSTKEVWLSTVIYCSFKYDSYEAALGERMYYTFPISYIEEYADKGWVLWDFVTPGDYNPDTGTYDIIGDYKVLDPENSPIVEFTEVKSIDGENLIVNVKLRYYKFYNNSWDEMPKFIMGTDKDGNVMFKYVFEGLRTSLLLGLGTFVVCFLFGLLWGSISGYFGGTVDLIMERITDILSGVPWIVVMTLVIINFGSTIWTFALALCLTGWIGTAATTRTQFYRFRGREYVLASRTLGANDARLIAKHILPNAMGTIITSAVLMIPSVIFSEATISYLGLGLKDLSSLGVILSNNQSELYTSPYLLIFPSIVIALLMISFNLFGNGLRDAVNPSLKGEE